MNIKLLNKLAKIPTKGSAEAAGYDLYAAIEEDVKLQPFETKKISTGISMAIPKGYFGAIYPRSGIATKRALRPANCVGVIDSDYRGEVIVALHNDSPSPQCIESGERIAQLIIQKYEDVAFDVVENLDDTERGSTGFGESGKF